MMNDNGKLSERISTAREPRAEAAAAQSRRDFIRSAAAVGAGMAGLAALAATATGGGKVLLYGGTGQGKVVFDGRTHASMGLTCQDCHTTPALFPMQKHAVITRPDHGQAKACCACCNGQKAFSECAKCHRKF